VKNKRDLLWDIKYPERYGVQFGPYDNSRFKPSRRLMFWAGVPSAIFIFENFFKFSRIGVIGREIEDQLFSQGKGIIYAHWHKYAALYFMYARHKRHVIMSSHKDSGEFGSRCMERVGILTVRGSTKKVKSSGALKDKKGKEALAVMAELIKNEKFHAGLTVDGPSGPAFRLKRGLVKLASDTGAPIVVMNVAAKPHFTLPSWDRMMLPAPWSKVIYFLTGPYYVPKGADDKKIEEIREKLENEMRDVEERVGLYWKDEGVRREFGEPIWI
jgi:lysophospholipid acyltransferase (LPLAT)-like uncharacterized protein